MTYYWNLSREEQAKIDAKGIDYDLRACLEHNPQSFSIFDIEKVLAVWTGERDEDDWRWVIKVTKEYAKTHKVGRFVFLQGGCDYTGWDCQSSADSVFAKTDKQAAEYARTKFRWQEDTTGEVYKSLVEQLKLFKKRTWHEKMDEELDTKDLSKL